MTQATMTSIATTAATVIALHCQLLPAIFSTAHTAMMGAFTMIWRPMATNSWIWVMSLVERVMRLAVENRFISPSENLSTFSNSLARMRLQSVDARPAAMKPVAIDDARLPRAQNIIP